MKALLDAPPGEKITEQRLLGTLAAYGCGILLCLACLVYTTWIWYIA